MVGLVGAINVYPGETKTIDNTLNDFDLIWSIQNNTTLIENLIINITVDKINITFPGDMPPCSFNILFKSESEEIVVSVSSSSGSSGSSSSSSSIIYVVDNVSGKDYGDASKYHRYNVEETVEETVEEYLPNKETIIIEPLTEEEKSYWKLWLPGIILILVTFILFKLATIKSHSSKHASHEQEENTNEKEVKIK